MFEFFIQTFIELVLCVIQTQTHSSLTGISRRVERDHRFRRSCGRSHYYGSAQRIFGGRPAQLGEFPWTVSLHRYGQFKCGGSIISDHIVITAAHCVDGCLASELTIHYNSLWHSVNGLQRSVSKVIIHPKYDNKTIDNDIAIVRLKNNLILDRLNSGTVCLPQKNYDISAGDVMTVTGWGLTSDFKSSSTLRALEIPIISLNTCRQQYKRLPKLYKITDNMICAGHRAGGEDACSGDSGGPLVKSFNGFQFVLIGIVSKGFGCALPEKAGVYTRVTNYVDWIHQNI